MLIQILRTRSHAGYRSGRNGSAKEGPIQSSGIETSFLLSHEKSITPSNIRGRVLGFLIALFLLVIITLIGYDHSEAVQTALPFDPGEKFIYEANWGSIPAGEASIEGFPFARVNDIDAYHFVMKTQTNAEVDPFYMIRDREDSYVDVSMTHSLLYLKRDLGKHPRNIEVI
jgi:hypothetical protein